MTKSNFLTIAVSGLALFACCCIIEGYPLIRSTTILSTNVGACSGSGAVPATYCSNISATNCGQAYSIVTDAVTGNSVQIPSGCTNQYSISACHEITGAGLDGEGEMKLVQLSDGSCGTYTQYTCFTTPRHIYDSSNNYHYTEYLCSQNINNSGGNCSGVMKVAVGVDGC